MKNRYWKIFDIDSVVASFTRFKFPRYYLPFKVRGGDLITAPFGKRRTPPYHSFASFEKTSAGRAGSRLVIDEPDLGSAFTSGRGQAGGVGWHLERHRRQPLLLRFLPIPACRPRLKLRRICICHRFSSPHFLFRDKVQAQLPPQ